MKRQLLERCFYYSATIFLTLCLVYKRDNHQNSSTTEPRKEDMLLNAIKTNKAFVCKQSLPYSKEMFKVDFIICMKDPLKDPIISAFFHINGYVTTGKLGVGVRDRYEEHIINVWLTLLKNYPQATVLDLGSNIGTYTLVSSKMGNQVISVDPSPQNHALLFNSVVLNDFTEDVTQVMNPISDGHYEYTGEVKHGSIEDSLDLYYANSYNGVLSSITLFDLFDLKPEEDTFIIKIDVEGFECKVLTEFLKMERKPKYVPYIQMEVTHHCSSGWKSQCFKTFKTEFLPLLEKSGYTPHVPWPITYEDLKATCYFDVLFVHKDAKPFPYNDPYLAKTFKFNSHYELTAAIYLRYVRPNKKLTLSHRTLNELFEDFECFNQPVVCKRLGMGALHSVPFCSRTAADDNNNLGDRPDLNLSEDEPPVCAVVQAQPEATSTPKEIGQFKI